jgi:hypothetical protein
MNYSYCGSFGGNNQNDFGFFIVFNAFELNVNV